MLRVVSGYSGRVSHWNDPAKTRGVRLLVDGAFRAEVSSRGASDIGWYSGREEKKSGVSESLLYLLLSFEL